MVGYGAVRLVRLLLVGTSANQNDAVAVSCGNARCLRSLKARPRWLRLTGLSTAIAIFKEGNNMFIPV